MQEIPNLIEKIIDIRLRTKESTDIEFGSKKDIPKQLVYLMNNISHSSEVKISC